MGIKWWDSKKWDLEKARKKIIKDKGLASRKKLMMNEMNNAGMSDSSEEEEEEEQWLVHMYVAWTEAVHVCTQTVRNWIAELDDL